MKKNFWKKSIWGFLFVLMLTGALRAKAWDTEAPAAVLSIHAHGSTGPGSLWNAGHTWLTITNTTGEKLPFMSYNIPAGENISVSIWPDSMSSGYGGVFINREQMGAFEKEDLVCTSYSMTISMKKLNQIAANTPKESYYHDGQGNDWDLSDDLTHNCTTYSTEMWNLVADEKHQISDGTFSVDVPGTVAKKIAKWEGSTRGTYTVSQRRYPKDTYYVFKDGTFALLEAIELSAESLEVKAGESRTLTAKFQAHESYYQTEEAKSFIQWESDNEEIAVVKDGVVTGLQTGDCTIRAYAEGGAGNIIEKECKVKVSETSWKEAYAEIMRNYRDERSSLTTRFAIRDMDGDGVPELFLTDGNYHMAQCPIYTWAKNENGAYEAVNLGEYGSSGVVQVVPGESFLLAGYMGQGFSIVTYYRLTNGHLEKMENFVQNVAGNPDVAPYTINDEEVSEEDFNSRKQIWSQKSSLFVTVAYEIMTGITEGNIEILLNADYQTS